MLTVDLFVSCHFGFFIALWLPDTFIDRVNSLNSTHDRVYDCRRVTCLNGGACILDHYGIEKCQCQDGFGGDYCDKRTGQKTQLACEGYACLNMTGEIRHVDVKLASSTCNESVGCKNNGMCNYTDGSCMCPNDYQGTWCEMKKSEHQKKSPQFCPSDIECLNGATCLKISESYVCLCQTGFTGRNCEIVLNDPCLLNNNNNNNSSSSSVCGPNAITCLPVQTDRRYSCLCKPNFTGLHCDVEIKFMCQGDSDCPDHSACKFTALGSNCRCTPGFTGSNCSYSTVAAFHGNSLLVHVLSKEGMPNRHSYAFTFDFRTVATTGMTVISGDSFFGSTYAINLVDNRISLNLNGKDVLLLDPDVASGQWFRMHMILDYVKRTVSLSLMYNNSIISMKSVEINHSLPKPLQVLFTKVGGSSLHHTGNNFVGCFRDININERELIPEHYSNISMNVEYHCPEKQCTDDACSHRGYCNEFIVKKTCLCLRPYVGSRCDSMIEEASFGYQKNVTFARIVLSAEDRAYFALTSHISGFFKTRQNSSLLVRFLGENSVLDIKILQGRISAILWSHNVIMTNETAKRVDNGEEHFFELIKYTDQLKISIDNVTILENQPFHNDPRSYYGDIQEIYLGGVPADSNIFKGTLRDWRVGEKRLINILAQKFTEENLRDFGNVSLIGPVLKGSVSDNMCQSEPCANNAQCQLTFNHYHCECSSSHWRGKHCEIENYCATRTCRSAYAQCLNLEPSGFICLPEVTFMSLQAYSKMRLVTHDKSKSRVKNIELELNDQQTTGIIFSLNNGLGSWITLEIKTGFLATSLISHEGNVKDLNSVIRLNDDHWHHISIDVSDDDQAGNLHRSISDNAHVERQHFFYIANNTELVVGQNNLTVHPVSFIGCIRNFVITVENEPNPHFDTVKETSIFVPVKDVEQSNDFHARPYYFIIDDDRDVTEGCHSSDACLENVCQNGGKCVSTLNSYECHCLSGFTGHNCELVSLTCVQNPCKNNGECFETKNRSMLAVACKCPPLFTGQFCEQPQDMCQGIRCLNGGICHHYSETDRFACVCLAGFTGLFCEINIDQCLHNPCVNGECIDVINAFECHCNPGWKGTHCDEDLNECDSLPCLNNGVCENLVGNFTCQCSEYHFGRTCEFQGSCLSNPCVHGECRQISSAEHSCKCESGYTGKFCDVKTSYCNSHPCLNGGKCLEAVGGFKCDCEGTGFMGEFCQEDLNECEIPVTCSNGNCSNFEGGYNCSCWSGFIGTKCDSHDPCFNNLTMASPCSNGGTCFVSSNLKSDTRTVYRCLCAEDFYGDDCQFQKFASAAENIPLVMYVGIPAGTLVLLGLGAVCIVLLLTAKRNRATRGTYSPSRQEISGIRLRFFTIMKPPPEERLI